MKRKYSHIALTFMLAMVLAVCAAADKDQQLDQQEAALEIIVEFADRFCPKVPLEGQVDSYEVEGKIDLKINEILRKLIDAGVEVSASYGTERYKGFLQEDLIDALKDQSECKQRVWGDLRDRFLGWQPTVESKGGGGKEAGMASVPFCRSYVVPSAFIEEIIAQAQAESGAPDYVHAVIRQAVYEGDYMKWVLLCGKDGIPYERNIGDVLLRVTPTEIYTDSLDRKCRGLSVVSKRAGRWQSTSQSFCSIKGRWRIVDQ